MTLLSYVAIEFNGAVGGAGDLAILVRGETTDKMCVLCETMR